MTWCEAVCLEQLGAAGTGSALLAEAGYLEVYHLVTFRGGEHRDSR